MKNWRNHLGLLLPLLVVAGLAVWPTITDNISNREIAFTILKAVALATSLNILLGYTGYVSFGHIVFYGFGGYVGLYFVNEQGWTIWTGMLAGGLIISSACIPTRKSYIALAWSIFCSGNHRYQRSYESLDQ